MHLGDLVFFNLAGTTLGNFDHTQIVTGITHHHIWVSQHSAACRKTFMSVLAGLHEHPDRPLSYVFVHLDHTGFNISPTEASHGFHETRADSGITST